MFLFSVRSPLLKSTQWTQHTLWSADQWPALGVREQQRERQKERQIERQTERERNIRNPSKFTNTLDLTDQ
jgi:hypothetical protein